MQPIQSDSTSGTGEMLRERNTLRRGLVAGLLGGLAVAVFFLIVDLINAQVFYTPAALGSALFYGANDPVDVVINAPVVVGYTFVHFAAFFLLGLFVAWVVEEADRFPPMLLGMVLFFVTLEVFSLGMLAAVASWLFNTIPWWTPIVANLLAAAAMVGYLWKQHPGLRGRLGVNVEDDVTAEKPIGAV